MVAVTTLSSSTAVATSEGAETGDVVGAPAGFDRLVAKREACGLLGVSYPKLWGLVQTGRFPPGRYVGTRVFWRASELETFIRSLPRQPTKYEAPAVRFKGVESVNVRRAGRRVQSAPMKP